MSPSTPLHRRDLLRLGLSAGSSGLLGALYGTAWRQRPQDDTRLVLPAYSVIPVVGDGVWIWNKPPADATGFLEPRQYELEVGIDIEALGPTGAIMATTPLPVECPEQKFDEERVEATLGEAQVRTLAPLARQLVFTIDELFPGQKATAVARYKLTAFKQYLKYQSEQFPAKQTVSREIRNAYLGDSTGIQTRAAPVRSLLKQLMTTGMHPWTQAETFAAWIREKIRPQIGPYTSVVEAIENLRGDCEEMSAVFIALCRAAGIPARLVWVPNHNWAEFHLVDEQGKGHWIPVHTACYHWFGWTGAHELVLQKGDRVQAPEKPVSHRLAKDWLRWQGKRPSVRYWAELKPLPPSDGKDAGPGARRKVESGEWQLAGSHPLDKYLRR